MIVYKVFHKNYELKKGELIGMLIERRKDLRGKTHVESGMRWARLTFGDSVKDKQAIFVVPNELKLESDTRWLMKKGVFTKGELLGMAMLVDQEMKIFRHSYNNLPPKLKSSVETEEKKAEPRYRTVNFERRKYPRSNVNLPVEYYPMNLSINHNSRAINVSEGGLLIYTPERMKIGQYLKLRLFFPSGFEVNTIETLVQVIWIDTHLGEGWGDYRTGVKFVDISSEGLNKLKHFLKDLRG
jgi:hypothetical protein